MNKVILMGRLTREPDIKYTSRGDSQMAVARYTLAVDRRFKTNADQQSADFISCVAFQKTAEFAEKYLHKGTKIVVVGRIQTGSYANREGQKVYTTEVVVDEQEFAESKAASSANNNSGGQYAAPATNNQSAPQTAPPADGGFMSIPDGVDDEGLPFV